MFLLHMKQKTDAKLSALSPLTENMHVRIISKRKRYNTALILLYPKMKLDSKHVLAAAAAFLTLSRVAPASAYLRSTKTAYAQRQLQTCEEIHILAWSDTLDCYGSSWCVSCDDDLHTAVLSSTRHMTIPATPYYLNDCRTTDFTSGDPWCEIRHAEDFTTEVTIPNFDVDESFDTDDSEFWTGSSGDTALWFASDLGSYPDIIYHDFACWGSLFNFDGPYPSEFAESLLRGDDFHCDIIIEKRQSSEDGDVLKFKWRGEADVFSFCGDSPMKSTALIEPLVMNSLGEANHDRFKNDNGKGLHGFVKALRNAEDLAEEFISSPSADTKDALSSATVGILNQFNTKYYGHDKETIIQALCDDLRALRSSHRLC